ncbi:uncharacterized protein LOC130933668 [Arachis stenosperma]|uniref:uncharacterized protein LOC130933668 n=1 Tax=Arachis stenosperma TaxID=217475 RepID=UPI0025AC3391|nr:uncharacterized protein LOC130933668 [Arachis stenosperma]
MRVVRVPWVAGVAVRVRCGGGMGEWESVELGLRVAAWVGVGLVGVAVKVRGVAGFGGGGWRLGMGGDGEGGRRVERGRAGTVGGGVDWGGICGGWGGSGGKGGGGWRVAVRERGWVGGGGGASGARVVDCGGGSKGAGWGLDVRVVLWVATVAVGVVVGLRRVGVGGRASGEVWSWGWERQCGLGWDWWRWGVAVKVGGVGGFGGGVGDLGCRAAVMVGGEWGGVELGLWVAAWVGTGLVGVGDWGWAGLVGLAVGVGVGGDSASPT